MAAAKAGYEDKIVHYNPTAIFPRRQGLSMRPISFCGIGQARQDLDWKPECR
jgi:hypothetical protein